MISEQTILALRFLDALESKKKFELGAKYPGSFLQKKSHAEVSLGAS